MKRRAFTLVELLVCIGVVALLVAILLPVLGSSRSAAQATTCLMSLNQLGQSWSVLMFQDNGEFPNTVTNGTDKRWDDRLLRANGIDPNVSTYVPLSCPTVLNRHGLDVSTAGRFTYGINVRWNIDGPAGENEQKNFDSIRLQSSYPLFADTFIRQSGSFAQSYDEFGVRPDQDWRLGFVHPLDTANVAYADGHVEAEERSILDGAQDINGVPLWFFNRGARESIALNQGQSGQPRVLALGELW